MRILVTILTLTKISKHFHIQYPKNSLKKVLCYLYLPVL